MLALAAPAQGQDQLAFERCPEPAEDWECATHTVPLDHSGAVPGTIDLAVRRFRPAGTPDPSGQPPFTWLAGGPGQGASLFFVPGLEEVFEAALSRYQLIVYDQRGTGLSGALSCPALADEEGLEDPTQEDAGARQVGRCAEQLGARRAFYTTLDSVADIDSLRQALSAETIGIGGVSYGTYVAAVYAQQHPDRTERIILDSVVPPEGDSVFQEPTFRAVPRVVTDQCDEDACEGVTPTPLGDLSRAAGMLRSGRISGILHNRRGRPRREALDSEHDLLQLMMAGDLNTALRAGQPAAVRAAARGDAAPLLRFAVIASDGAGAEARGQEDEVLREFSAALFATTLCTDNDFPWPASMPPGEERNRLFGNAAAAVPWSVTRPFGREALRRSSLAFDCRLWPLTDSAPPPDHPPFPDVPTLIVNGTADLRTPISSSITARVDFAPAASLVLVEGQGHSVLGQAECADAALGRFFADQPIGDPCGEVDEAEPVQPLAPRRMRLVPRAAGVRGPRGRTLGAALATIGDARWLVRVHRGRFRVGGLRNGWVAFQSGREPRRARFVLRQLAYVPGVRLSGKLRIRNDGRLVGRLGVRGARAVNGIVRFRPNGRVIGRLGGQRVRTRDNTR